MKFKVLGAMKSNPGFSMVNTIAPVNVSTSLHGSVTAGVGAISIGVSEIPVRLRVPFLKRTVQLQVIGTVGGIKVKMDPFNLSIKDMSVSVNGLLGGKDGITVTTEGSVSCSTEMDAAGFASGKIHSERSEDEHEECQEPNHKQPVKPRAKRRD